MADNLFAAIDMGTNAFKLLIVEAQPPGKFLPILTRKEPIVLGRDSPSSTISPHSQRLSFKSLEKFSKLLKSHNVPSLHTRCVATSAVREARNKAEFVNSVAETTGFNVEVLSGEQEATFSYLGSLQFLPVFDHSILNIDIGGGSTEFAIGSCGKVDFSMSLKLGHITLTQHISEDKEAEKVQKMREYVRKVVRKSGLIEKVKTLGFEVAVGSSGTVRAIEKAGSKGHGIDLLQKEPFFKDCEVMNWRLSREKISSVVESSCKGGKLQNGKRRAESIVAGGILLEEIFDLVGIKEMLVSGYGLREGVIADTLAKVYAEDYDLEANSRFQSLLWLATSSFNGGTKTGVPQSERVCRLISRLLRLDF
ncbi:hypothetical protein like AT1G09195 [Hibiscus trionum]|uniref:Ppx/GppA phosphatase N-terminal domain-containing protein n=1 Tax=Hibiscus trionum TaxID=183268 RepID=A0A9W7IX32_HIBTR|nr:hypothetical protein like AT1G09195 [Hibiscus trionum]